MVTLDGLQYTGSLVFQQTEFLWHGFLWGLSGAPFTMLKSACLFQIPNMKIDKWKFLKIHKWQIGVFSAKDKKIKVCGFSQLHIMNNENLLNIRLFAGLFLFVWRYFSPFQPNIAIFPKVDGTWIQGEEKSLHCVQENYCKLMKNIIGHDVSHY